MYKRRNSGENKLQYVMFMLSELPLYVAIKDSGTKISLKNKNFYIYLLDTT
jgi:hypothetical protein